MDKKSLTLFWAKAITSLSTALVQFLLARWLSPNDFGWFVLGMGMMVTFNWVSDLGFHYNGAVWMRNGTLDWQSIQGIRSVFSILASLFYLVFVCLFYLGNWGLLCFLPGVLFFWLNNDWYHRSMLAFQRAAMRQIVQAILGLLVLFLGFWGRWSWPVFGLAYSSTVIGAAWVFKQSLVPKGLVFRWQHSYYSVLKKQSHVFFGFLWYQLAYMLPLLYLGWQGDAAMVGRYGAHYFLFTSAATVLLIVQDIYFAKLPDQVRGFRWVIFGMTALGMMVLMGGRYYFHWFYGGQIPWDPQMGLSLALLLGIHTLRITWINAMVIKGKERLFHRFGTIGLLLMLLLLAGLYITSMQGGYWPLWALMLAEGLLLIFERITHGANQKVA